MIKLTRFTWRPFGQSVSTILNEENVGRKVVVHFMNILQTMTNIASITMKIKNGRNRGDFIRILFDKNNIDSDTINSLNEMWFIG